MGLPDHRAAPWVLFGIHAALLLITLPDYGASWDEPGWFRYGYEQWMWVLGLSSGPLEDPANYFHYGSLPSMCAAVSNLVFHRVLGWLPKDSAYHLSNVGFALLLTLGILVWARRAYGNRLASLALLLWIALPRLWPHQHYNISDLPGATGALWAAWAAWRISLASRPLLRDYLLFGALMGVAFSLRAPNVYFLAVALALWVAVSRLVLLQKWPGLRWWGILFAIAVFFLVVKVCNPFLWQRSVFLQVLVENPHRYLFSSIGRLPVWFGGSYDCPSYYSLWLWLISTPWIHILGMTIAAVTIARRGRGAAAVEWMWLLLWSVAIAKHLGGAGNYDGVRHFLESYPLLVLLAARGLLSLGVVVRRARRVWRVVVAAVLVLGLLEPMAVGAWIHPYETGYFNRFAGPLAAAWERYEIDYWGQSYVAADCWVRANVEPGSVIRLQMASSLADRLIKPDYDIELGHDGAQPGDLLLLLNRRSWLNPDFYRDSAYPVPPGWELVHRIGPSDELPPTMVILRKQA